MNRKGWLGFGMTLGGAVLCTMAQAQSVTVYRCPGPPVLYTDALTPAEARERGCRQIEGAPITVLPSPRVRPGAGASGAVAGAAGAGAASVPRPADSKIEPAAQRQRDADARRILDSELKREEAKLVALKQDYNNGEPERQGNERNYQSYLDRVAAMKASIARTESDIAAIKRELAKFSAG